LAFEFEKPAKLNFTVVLSTRSTMPPKIRDLIAQLEKAGFKDRGGKGSHRNFVHPKVAQPITISGRTGDDAKLYQTRAVAKAIEEARK
jgi:predicted RNA binding protein YcfA (HicA-like mRNA interferase family)